MVIANTQSTPPTTKMDIQIFEFKQPVLAANFKFDDGPRLTRTKLQSGRLAAASLFQVATKTHKYPIMQPNTASLESG
jgi:hypothetical protein